MKTELICQNVKRKAVLGSLMTAGLRELIEDPRVVVIRIRAEYRANASPAFRVAGWLSLAGPDVKGAGQGVTLDAAVHLAVRQLARGLRLRSRHQELNRHNRLQTPKATRDRFLRVWAGAPSSRCPATFRQKQPYQYVMF